MVEHVIRQIQPSANKCTVSTLSGLTFDSQFVSSGLSVNQLPTFPTVSSWITEQSVLNGAGATGWKRARPGNPVVDAGQWLAELRSLPTLPLRLFNRLRSFQSLGSEYLNVQFGWRPFVGDVIKMYQLYNDLDKRLAQLVRDNGRAIRRRRTVLDSTETTSTVTNYPTTFGAFWPPPSSPIGMTFQSTMTKQIVTSEKAWFVASFRYYVPDIGSPQWTSRATRALFGVNPTPDLLYNVLPWTWLIDYFANVGDVVSNLSSNAVDNLVANYAYVMRTKTVTTTYTSVGTISGTPLQTIFKMSGGSYAATTSEMVQTKSRARATPYGFGITLGSLSGYQLGILGALGISRQRFL